jgi:hypothetical protein
LQPFGHPLPIMPTTSRHAVALGNPGEPHANTIVLGGATVIVPLEMDADNDPLHDDEVRLWSPRGGYDRTILADDPAVLPDPTARLIYYPFDDVPLGVYRVAVCVAGVWHDLMHDLVVARDGTYLGGKKLATEKPAMEAASWVSSDEDDAPDDDSDGLDAQEPRQRTFDQAASEEGASE